MSGLAGSSETPASPLAASTTDGSLAGRLERANEFGDPLADQLVEEFRQLPGGAGWRLLDRALAGGLARGAVRGMARGDASHEAVTERAADDLPADRATTAEPEATALLAELVAPALAPPAWVDLERVERGAVAYWRAGAINLSLALTCGSLAFGYQSPRLSRPLSATGRLNRMAPRRLQETSDWLTTTTRPGALQPGGVGIAATVRLRVVHALVRRHLSDSPDWLEGVGRADQRAGRAADRDRRLSRRSDSGPR